MKVVMIGTGSAGKSFLDCVHGGTDRYDTGMPEGGPIQVDAVFDRSPDVAGTVWNGYEVKHESELKEYLDKQPDDVKIVIASHYVDLIIERLKRQGIDPKKCYAVVNGYKTTIYHNSDVIAFSDSRYQDLENMLEAGFSKQILNNIKQFRGNDNILTVPVERLLGYSIGEDYWGTVKPFRRFDKAVVIDGGAYTGDIIEPLCSAIGAGIIHYYAFEPDSESYEQLAKRPQYHNLYGELSAIQKGLWSVETELLFNGDYEDKKCSNISNEGKEKIITQSIDNMEIEADTDIFIKMDVEGAELEALKGAEKLIRERKPSLAICVYHKENDIIEIPLYLKSLVPEYKLYLCGGCHTTCIAQIEE